MHVMRLDIFSKIKPTLNTGQKKKAQYRDNECKSNGIRNWKEKKTPNIRNYIIFEIFVRVFIVVCPHHQLIKKIASWVWGCVKFGAERQVLPPPATSLRTI